MKTELKERKRGGVGMTDRGIISSPLGGRGGRGGKRRFYMLQQRDLSPEMARSYSRGEGLDFEVLNSSLL